jgi:hypothetical protein
LPAPQCGIIVEIRLQPGAREKTLIQERIMSVASIRLEAHRIHKEPFYLPQGDELAIAEASYRQQLPLLLKGPTGCGNRFPGRRSEK